MGLHWRLIVEGIVELLDEVLIVSESELFAGHLDELIETDLVASLL